MSLLVVPKELRADAIREIEDWAKRTHGTATFTGAEMLTICEEIYVLRERISEAREILTASIPQSQLALEIIRAVEALEGK